MHRLLLNSVNWLAISPAIAPRLHVSMPTSASQICAALRCGILILLPRLCPSDVLRMLLFNHPTSKPPILTMDLVRRMKEYGEGHG